MSIRPEDKTFEHNPDPTQQMIRKVVRSTYDLQKSRIQFGNRLVAAYKDKLGIDKTKTEDKADKEARMLLERLRASYDRITDGIAVTVNGLAAVPKAKGFKPDDLIENYIDFALANQYFSTLQNEERQFKMLESILKEVPVYRDYLVNIPGLGVQSAGVLISEIDIYVSTYSSSLIQLSGLSTASIGYYIDDKGKEIRLSLADLSEAIAEAGGVFDEEHPVKYAGHEVRMKKVASSRNKECLINRQYKDHEGEIQTKKSITYNPWLRTKLIGVMAPSFLKQTYTTVDGVKMSKDDRLQLAASLGFKSKEVGSKLSKEIKDFLGQHGHVVETYLGEYAKIYYNYRNRLDSDRRHDGKTALHKHNMGLRYMMKCFLSDLYAKWREIEGLPVYKPYAEEKLGIKHAKPTQDHFDDPMNHLY